MPIKNNAPNAVAGIHVQGIVKAAASSEPTASNAANTNVKYRLTVCAHRRSAR